jgi:hypothetical protein
MLSVACRMDSTNDETRYLKGKETQRYKGKHQKNVQAELTRQHEGFLSKPSYKETEPPTV